MSDPTASGDPSAPPLHPGLFDDVARDLDALLILGFGGPEGMDEVVPFLERVTAGRGIPRERLVEVGAHYELFGGVSPINAQTRALVEAVREELRRRGIDVPLYWANRNSAPFVEDVVATMHADGVRHAAFLPTSVFSSYSGCRQYREDIARACASLPQAPDFVKLRTHGNHPGFVEPMGHRLRAALAGVPEGRRAEARVVFTAHSIPVSMARSSDYVNQLADSALLVLQAAGASNPHDLVWQSRSGPPQVPWLEPDVGDHLEELADDGVRDVVLVPLGFVSDHVEVLFDLDVEARAIAGARGVHLVRAGTVGADPAYVRLVVDLFEERRTASPDRPTVGQRPAGHDVCLATCCPNLRSPDTAAVAQA